MFQRMQIIVEICDCVISVHPLKFLGAIANFEKATIGFVISIRLSVRPHGTTLFPLDGFS
jgi:hypothetical protein